MTVAVNVDELRGVFSVPPLARRADPRRSLDFEQNDLIVRHIASGGVTRFIYGGNAFLYHITLQEYDELLGWLSGLPGAYWMIPSLGPSYGRAMDQAALLRHHNFRCAMMLPCQDPRSAAGLESGLEEIAQETGKPLILYLKDENNFGSDRDAGLDVVARLVDRGICVAVKYAVVRADPSKDAYLDELLKRVDRRRVISGIGERPAVIHLRDWQLRGFTTGSGCIAPSLSNDLLTACQDGDFSAAESIREQFIPLEDLRDSLGPAPVLHNAVELAEIARMGPVPPFVSAVTHGNLARVAKELAAKNAKTAAI
jgi:dihydrodipicolinate synthase/N-acetylneuraminate lyase